MGAPHELKQLPVRGGAGRARPWCWPWCWRPLTAVLVFALCQSWPADAMPQDFTLTS